MSAWRKLKISLCFPAIYGFQRDLVPLVGVQRAKPFGRPSQRTESFAIGRIFGGELQNIPGECFVRGGLLQEKRPPAPILMLLSFDSPKGESEPARSMPRLPMLLADGTDRRLYKGKPQTWVSPRKLSTGQFSYPFLRFGIIKNSALCGERPRALPSGHPRFFEKNRVKLLCRGKATAYGKLFPREEIDTIFLPYTFFNSIVSI